MAASTVIVEERTGKRRRVELVGGALPLQGANWGGLQLLVTRWNPGNPEATQHVLGPQEVPSAWDFMLRTTTISRTPVRVFDGDTRVETTLVRAISIALLLEDMFRGGALLKVTWISNAQLDRESSPRISRVGRCSAWDFTPDRPDDIPAHVTFDWMGRGEDQAKASDLRGEDVLAVTQQAILAANAAADAISAAFIRRADRTGPGATTFTLGQLEAIANGPLELVDSFARAANSVANRMQRIGDLILQVRELPAAILGRLVDVANNGLAVATQFMDAVSREGPETQSLRGKVSTLGTTASYFSGAQTQAELMADVMERVAEAARRRRSGLMPAAGVSRGQDQARTDDAFRVHLPRAGETMASIAQRYYGSPDLGDELAVANGLPGYTVTPPRIPIIIPTRRNLDESARNRV